MDVELISKAAAQDDRWWFLAMVIAGGLSATWAVRYLVKRNEETVQGRLSDLKEMIRERDQIIERQVESNNELRDAVKELASAVRELKDHRDR